VKRTVCVENTDEWGNSHDYIVVGDDIAIDVREVWRRKPWSHENYTIITSDLRVIRYNREVYTPQSYCSESKIDEEYVEYIVKKDPGLRRAFWKNLCRALESGVYREDRYEIKVKVHDKDVAEFIKREICARLSE
jgi:hypothetical protein